MDADAYERCSSSGGVASIETFPKVRADRHISTRSAPHKATAREAIMSPEVVELGDDSGGWLIAADKSHSANNF